VLDQAEGFDLTLAGRTSHSAVSQRFGRKNKLAKGTWGSISVYGALSNRSTNILANKTPEPPSAHMSQILNRVGANRAATT